jgi:ATP sulfurylase
MQRLLVGAEHPDVGHFVKAVAPAAHRHIDGVAAGVVNLLVHVVVGDIVANGYHSSHAWLSFHCA